MKKKYLCSLLSSKKHVLFYVMVAALSGILGTTQAQSLSNIEVENAIKADGKYAMLVQTSRHLRGAITVGAEMRENSPDMQFVITMAGPVVKELAEDESLVEAIKTAKEHGIELIACEFAMKRLNIEKRDYHSYIQTTPNVYRYMFGIQEIGYKILTL